MHGTEWDSEKPCLPLIVPALTNNCHSSAVLGSCLLRILISAYGRGEEAVHGCARYFKSELFHLLAAHGDFVQ